MRTTLDIPKELIDEAMAVTKSKTKTELIKKVLKETIQKQKVQILKNYQGEIDLAIDLDVLRGRK